METHQPELRPTVPGDTQMFRSEEFHHETGMVQNRIMQYERLSSLPDPRGQAGRMDRQSFREAGADGRWRTGDRFLNPRSIEDITESTWHGMDQQAEFQMLKTSGNEAILDSVGSPIVRKMNRGKGRVHEILSLEPAEQAVRSDNGHHVQKFNVRDADGVKMQGINAWLDDMEHYAWESVRLGRNDRPPWKLEGGPSSERPKDDPPTDHPSDSQPPQEDPPKQNPPKQDPPKQDPPNVDPPSDGPPASSGDTSSPSSSPPTNGDNPSSSDGDDSNGLDVSMVTFHLLNSRHPWSHCHRSRQGWLQCLHHLELRRLSCPTRPTPLRRLTASTRQVPSPRTTRTGRIPTTSPRQVRRRQDHRRRRNRSRRLNQGCRMSRSRRLSQEHRTSRSRLAHSQASPRTMVVPLSSRPPGTARPTRTRARRPVSLPSRGI